MNTLRPLPQAPSHKVDFNAIPAPSNYVPGLGRGATGFTTRSDIGPARMAPEMPAAGAAAPGRKEGEEGEPQIPDEKKFDKFLGNDEGLFSSWGEYDEEDKQADAVWESIDNFMDQRRRDRREKRLKDEIEKLRAENPKITEQFADLKRKLSEVSKNEWEAIPDIGDYTVKKQRRMQSFVPVPDTLLAKAAAEKETMRAIDPGSGLLTPGLATPMGGTKSTVSDLTAIGSGRTTVLELKLDRMADSVSGQTVVDPKGYMSDQSLMKISTDAEISDIKKARELLKSVIQTNPKHAPGWIAMARLEERAGKLSTARGVVQQGCDHCPKSEDVWLEAARLATPADAKSILAQGVQHIADSVKLWMAAAKLEDDDAAKTRVLRRALERVPTSVRLWKAIVELADEANARILLSRAVECCPQHVDLWLALARLESYDNAKKVLNKARLAIPTEAAIWITAAKLEEANGNKDMVPKIVDRALKSLSTNGVVLNRGNWLKEAENAERATPPMVATCRAIINGVINLGIDEEDKLRTYMADADDLLRSGSVHSARAVLDCATQSFPGEPSVWRARAQLEKLRGTRELLDEVLERAVRYCPQAEVLWLMAAKEKWLGGNVDAARSFLEVAYAANPDSEKIFLAAFKLEFENNELQRARGLLAKGRSKEATATEKVWMKSAVVERELGNPEGERELLEEGVRLYPGSWKMWLMRGQLAERTAAAATAAGDTAAAAHHIDSARSTYTTGLKRCMDCAPMWRAAARLEETAGNLSKARAILEQARLKNAKNEELWLAAIRCEARAGNTKAAEALLAKALQDCPASGPLWAEAIAMAPRPQRKSKSSDALKRCDNDPHIFAAVAQLFWTDRKVDKARSWFSRAVTLNPDIGDFWALFYKFELQHGSAQSQGEVMEKCKQADPHHGERWQRVAKDPANLHLPIEKLLLKVIVDIDTLPPP